MTPVNDESLHFVIPSCTDLLLPNINSSSTRYASAEAGMLPLMRDVMIVGQWLADAIGTPCTEDVCQISS